jgi:hypothetical protein
MGIHNSSETRVRPILGKLLTTYGTDAGWVLRLWELTKRGGGTPAQERRDTQAGAART